jgi:hypothetical protein
MNLTRIVPDRVTTTALTSALVGLASISLLYGLGRPTFMIVEETATLPIYVFETVIAWYAYRMPRDKSHSLLPLLPWSPILRQIVIRISLIASPWYSTSELPWFIGQVVYLWLLFIAVRSTYASWRRDVSQQSTSEPIVPANESEKARSATGAEPSAEHPAYDMAVHISVTEAVRRRSRQTSEGARLSMIIMILLVLVGGGASVGLWFFGQLDRIRTVELERMKLLHLSTNLDRLSTQTTTQQAENVAQLRRFVQDNYGQDNSYQALLRDIAAKAQTSWPDIAIRATVAILTLFLVQIFFSVYKYSLHLSNILAAKAEALELVGVSSEDRQNLRKEMIAVATEGAPGFSPGPNTPLQELLDIVEKLKKAKAE